MRVKSIYKVLPLLFAVLFLCSCATADFSNVDATVVRGDYSAARRAIDAQKDSLYSDTDKVLYNLDAGLLSHYSGDWNQSNKNFSEAEGLIEEYYSKSISQGVSSYFVNDLVVDYAGEDYEDIYTNFFMALNYIHLGKFEDAMVEIRRFDNKQKLLTTKYASQMEYAENELGSGYSNVALQFQNSAAARYLSMLLYRANGQPDSAEVDRKLLLRAFSEQPSLYDFSVPSCVNDELSVPKGKARLNFVAFTGQAPIKIEDVERYDVGDGVYCKIALPLMVDRGSSVSSISVDVYDASGVLQTTVESVPEDYYVEPETVYEPEYIYEDEDDFDDFDDFDAKDPVSRRSAYFRVNTIIEDTCSPEVSNRVKRETGITGGATNATTRTSSSSDNLSAATPISSPSATSSTASSTTSSSSSDTSTRSAAARARALVTGVNPDAGNSSSNETAPTGLGGTQSNFVPTGDALYRTQLEKIESIENIALDTFGQHASVIASRAMIRAIGKTMKTGALSLASELTDDSSLSMLFSVLSFASQVTDEITEQADLRTSRFFPAYIYVGGITLDPGVYTIVVSFRGSSGQVMSSNTYENVNVTAKSVNIVEAICSR
ncbi:MAG: hypothetical protein J5647_11615 [Spirochaetaceae bacterium]|nr:hypothetical protein [Spirochaetaceae bacterium]